MKSKSFLSLFDISLSFLTTFIVSAVCHDPAGLLNLKLFNEQYMVNRKKINASAETVGVLTRYDVKQGYQEKFREALSKYVEDASMKKTNIMAEGYYEHEHPSIHWVIERWRSKTELNKNRNGANFKTVQLLSERMLIHPAKTIFVKDLEPLSKDEWRREPEKEDTPITIMLFVDSRAGTADLFKKVYHTAMPQFRAESGVINYQLSQLEEDSTQFVTYEKFKNEEAFQYHLKFPPIEPVINYLNTNIKKQPFQTGLHRLIRFAPVVHQ